VTISKRTLSFTLLSILVFFTSTNSARAQGEVQVSVEVSYDYGSELRVLAEVSSPTPVRRAALFYRSSKEDQTEVAYADLQIDEASLAHAVIDLHTQPLPPFSTILYWWHFDFEDSSTLETSPDTFSYIDNRFEWKVMEQNSISLHWVDGDLEYGQSALNAAGEALAAIESTLALPAPASVEVYLYPTQEQLRAGLQIGGRTWVAGHSRPELGVLLLAASPNTDGLIQLEGDIPHELTHLMLYERMGESYKHLPSWFNEGIAVLQEPTPDAAYRIALQEAAASDTLIPLESLCSAFPFAEGDALLAYGESASFMGYLRDIYGAGAFVQLLDTYREGASCTGGVQRVYQRSLSQLESEWRQSLSPRSTLLEPLRPVLPWALLVLPPILISLFAWTRRRTKPNPTMSGDEP
jgi:hypothetical protein